MFDGNPDVHFYFRTPSRDGYQLTNSYTVLDIAVRTIRNLVGRISSYNPSAFGDVKLLEKVVEIYNNTVHSAFKNKFTPQQMQSSYELEALYIKAQRERLNYVEALRLKAGLLTYESGSILLIHIPIEKTTRAMEQKRRRNFDELAIFRGYKSGNAVVDLLNPFPNLSRLIIPIYFTKFLARDIDEYRKKYGNQFVIRGN
jgi:hypothetical protein